MQAQDLTRPNTALHQAATLGQAPNPLAARGIDVQAAQNYNAQKEREAAKAKEQAQNQPEFNYKDFTDFDSNETAAKINDEKTTDTLLAINDKPQPNYPSELEHTPTETNKTIYTLGARNTGISYFDNKQNLTLLDAYIAKQLGLKTDRLVHKFDIKSDNKHRVDSASKVADASSKAAFYSDSFMRSFATALANDMSNNFGALSQFTRDKLQGIVGVGSATEQKARNSAILAIAMKSAGGSSQLSQARLDMHSKEILQAENIRKKAQLYKQHLLDSRDLLVQNIKRAQANGALGYAQNDMQKIAEIDQFIKLIDNHDAEGIAQFIVQKGSFTPQPLATEQEWRNPLAES